VKTCTLDDCDDPLDARGYCTKHYQRWQAHGDPLIVLKPYASYVRPTCSVGDCGKPVRARGWCSKHYQRWQKYGDPLMVIVEPGRSLEERFWEKVDKNGPVPECRPDLGPCWVWTGATAEGYGVITVDGHLEKAHILTFTWAKGDISEGWERDHLCRVRNCVRPDHLEAVTGRENQHRGESPWGQNSRKTHCPKNHLYDEANTYITPKGSRVCRTCRRTTMLAYYYRRQAAKRAAA
jgi:hypothetical protein